LVTVNIYALPIIPKITEVGYLSGIVNIYIKCSQLVRSTNTMLQKFRATKDAIVNAKNQMLYMYRTVKRFKDVKYYDMDTWEDMLDDTQILLQYEVPELVYLFKQVDYYTVGNVEQYSEDIHNIGEYDIRLEQNRKNVQHLFLDSEYRNAAVDVERQIVTSQIMVLQQEIMAIQDKAMSEERELTQDEKNTISLKEDELHQQEQKLATNDFSFKGSKIDSLMKECNDIISINMTEIQRLYSVLESFETEKNNLKEAFDRLVSGVITTQKKESDVVTTIDISSPLYNDIDPDLVPQPGVPENLPTDQTGKKEVSHEDILNFQNAINFLLLKQESILRDIDAMKVNTLSLLLAIQVFHDYKFELSTTRLATHGAVWKDIVKN